MKTTLLQVAAGSDFRLIDQQSVIIEKLLALNKQSKEDSDTPSAI